MSNRDSSTDRLPTLTPIIIATTRSAEEDRLLAKDLGVEVWMVKPVQEGALLKTIDHLLKD